MRGSANARTVRARSSAETPVEVDRWSTLTVNAVACASVLSETICGNRSASSRSPGIGVQMIPVVCRTMNAIWAAVTSCAAITRSPSFSRSASSVTTTIRPWERLCRAAWTAAATDRADVTFSVIALPRVRSGFQTTAGGRSAVERGGAQRR